VRTTQPAEKDAPQPADEDAPRPAGSGAPLATIRLATILGTLVTAALLGILSATAGLGVAGWITGLVAGCAVTALIVTARMRSDQPSIHPADWATLTRALLIAGVAGLVADSFSRPASVTALVILSSVALALDAVDGQVARRTGTATPLGARFDGETDAFLILLLSIVVSQDYGGWVLAIGAARYALLLAGWLIPWLRAPLPPRFWRKVVAAVQGVVLTVAISGVFNRLVGIIAVAIALLLLTESFGRDVVWLYRAGAGPRARLAVRYTIAALAFALLWFALLLPERTYQISFGDFVRIPIELLVLVAVALVLPPWPRRIVAAVAGVLFGILIIAKFLNMAYYDLLNRAFNPVTDWPEISQAKGVVQAAIGARLTWVVLIVLVIALVVLVGLITTSAVHLTAVAARHRRGTVRGLAALAAVWGLSAGLSLQLIPGSPIASASETGVAIDQVRATQAALADPRVFGQAIHSADPEAAIPAADLLTGLRGKDVIIDFVESYGQVAVQGTSFSPGIDAVLRTQQSMLTAAGWSTESAWAGSPTSGGVSWLAHSSLLSGLWVNSQQRYNELLASQRFTLSDAFNKAGWRTVADSPEDEDWPPGSTFYHYAQIYNRRNVGYQGPSFSYSAMPDQYMYAEFQRLELAPGHKPVMAVMATTSSHTPWVPLPSMVPWNEVGDGSVFDSQRGTAADVARVWSDTNTVRQNFGQSIQYSMTALTSWVTELNDPNLVLILLGDEQPHSTVSGPDPDNYVPISIITRDPSVLSQISSWHWQDGLLPNSAAPFEEMDAFRNQFLNTFSTAPAQAASALAAAR
jgi:phosphatidylglycerophosphate synthase